MKKINYNETIDKNHRFQIENLNEKLKSREKLVPSFALCILDEFNELRSNPKYGTDME